MDQRQRPSHIDVKKNVDRLVPITRTLVEQRVSLAEALDVAPLVAGNVVNAYNPDTRTLDGRTNLNEISMGGPLLPLPATGAAVSGDAPATERKGDR